LNLPKWASYPLRTGASWTSSCSQRRSRARTPRIQTLFLLTNTRSQAAINLYGKLGFVHDPRIMARYGRLYARCSVAMSYRLAAARTQEKPLSFAGEG